MVSNLRLCLLRTCVSVAVAHICNSAIVVPDWFDLRPAGTRQLDRSSGLQAVLTLVQWISGGTRQQAGYQCKVSFDTGAARVCQPVVVAFQMQVVQPSGQDCCPWQGGLLAAVSVCMTCHLLERGAYIGRSGIILLESLDMMDVMVTVMLCPSGTASAHCCMLVVICNGFYVVALQTYIDDHLFI
jgi:hypothetical protein